MPSISFTMQVALKDAVKYAVENADLGSVGADGSEYEIVDVEVLGEDHVDVGVVVTVEHREGKFVSNDELVEEINSQIDEVTAGVG